MTVEHLKIDMLQIISLCNPAEKSLASSTLYNYNCGTAYPMGHSSQKQLSNVVSSRRALNRQHVERSLQKGRLETPASVVYPTR